MNLSMGGVTLRALEPTDALSLYSMLLLPEIEEMVVGWSGPVSLDSQRAWIQQIKPTDFRYAIEYETKMCGSAHISPIDFKNRSANINLKILPGHQGIGLGRLTVTMLTDYLFRELDMAIVTAGILETNEASRRLFERSGFKLDGTMRSRVHRGGKRLSVHQYSVLREEFLNESL